MTATPANFLGSQAFNRTSDVSETIIPNTGSLLLGLPLFKMPGLRDGIGLDLKLTYGLGMAGRLGLPDGWSLGIPYLTPGDALNINNQRYIIDPTWSDASGYTSGLKYENNHGVSFVDHVTAQPLPNGASGSYQFTYHTCAGDTYYFDSSGKLVMRADLYANFLLYAYNTSDWLDHITDSYGQVTKFGYNPNQLLITAADGRVCTLNYSGHGIDSFTNPNGETTAFTYVTQDNLDVIAQITYPTGKTSLFTYTNIGFLDANGTSLSIPAVSDQVFKDASGAVLAHYQYAYGTNSGGNTYTGATQGYKLSAASDGLLDSDNTLYQYNVERRSLDASGKIVALRDTFYNFSHVALTDRRYITQADGTQDGYHQTLSSYEITPNQHNRQPNYLSPKSAQSGFVAQGSTTPVEKAKTAYGYDAYGNTTSEEVSLYDDTQSAFVKTLSRSTSYFSGAGMVIQTLPDTMIRTDHVAGTALKEVNALTADKRAIASTDISSQAASGAWSNWKARQHSYDSHGRATMDGLKWTKTGAPGVIQTSKNYAYKFDASQFSLTKATTDALGHVSQLTISTMNGQKTNETRASGAVTSYAYDVLGRLISTTSPSGNTQTQSYKVFSKDGENSTTVTTPMGYAKTQHYDALNRLIKETDNGNPTAPGQARVLAVKAYDVLGNVVSDTDRFGNATTYVCLSNGRAVQSVDALGNTQTADYDYATNTTITSLNGIVQKTVIEDNAGNILSQEIAPNTANPDSSSQYSLRRVSSYDGNGHRVSKTVSRVDTQGAVTQISAETYVYDPEYNVIETEFSAPDGSQRKTTTVFDLLNKEISHSRDVTMADSSKYTLSSDVSSYDALGQKTKLVNALGQSEMFTYTPDGQLETSTSFGGDVMTCSYGPDGERLSESWNDPSATKTTFGYDKDGHRVTVSDASGTVKTTYALDGTVTQVTYPDGKSVTDTLDAYSRKTARTDASGAVTKYSYTALNQLDTVTTGTDTLSYSYYKDTTKNQSFGAVESVTLAGKYTETYQYDAHNRRNRTDKVAPNGTNLLTEITQTNSSGKMAQSVKSSALSPSDTKLNRSTLYTYDGFDQLTARVVTDAQNNALTKESFVYDGNGNVLVHDLNAASTKYTYNAINQLMQYAESGKPAATQSYDANGRLTRDGAQRQYSYDVRGWLTVITGGKTTSYGYYPTGLMQERSSAGVTTSFYYDSNKQVVTTSNGSENTTFLLVGSRRFASYKGSADGYYFGTTQQQNTVLGLTKASALVGSSSYLAYGAAQDDTLALSAANAFTWKQEYSDPDQGLVYLRSRFYDPATMRFLTMDSKLYDNRYAFGNADPINNMDPTGHDALDYVGLGIGLTVGIAAVAAVTYVAMVYGPAIMAFASAVTALAGGGAAMGGIAAGGFAAGAMVAVGAGGAGGAALGGAAGGAMVLAAGGSYGSAIGTSVGVALGSMAADSLGLGTGGTMLMSSAGGYVGAVAGTFVEPMVTSALTTASGAVTGAFSATTSAVSGVASGVMAGATTAAETATATVTAATEMAAAGATAAAEAVTATVGAVAASVEAGDVAAMVLLGLLALL